MTAPCYRCQGPTESNDNIQEWSFLGGSIASETDVTESRRIRVRSTTVSHKQGRPRPTVCDDKIPLCRTCWLAVMAFVGVGKRPADRMAGGSR